MEPITEMLCIIPQILEFVVWGILMIIFGVINGIAGLYVVGVIWCLPIFILSSIALILFNLVSIPLIPLCMIFPNLWIQPNMCLSFLANSTLVGALPFVLAVIPIVLAIIVAVIQAISYPVLILGCNSNGIALCSKVSQTILSWICA